MHLPGRRNWGLLHTAYGGLSSQTSLLMPPELLRISIDKLFIMYIRIHLLVIAVIEHLEGGCEIEDHELVRT
jgi:hypothetical protein